MARSKVRDFPAFAIGVTAGILDAVTSDPDTFLLGVSGLCLGGRSKHIRGVGIALGGLFLARRADRYMGFIDSKMMLLAQLIREGNIREAPNG